ncbi:UvrD-helicase domain-containing protein [uncultured Rikenella sp.]|uniref:UvrD-helicase domain-containing protein n=1 Tax=uncultured Rikenella sp. TaxID=368003 RepID=UPI0025D6F22C|nr:UvrD-helicase domain-containing protein [uncultured Rikenella sp.]
MNYKERISGISNLTMEAIIENCRSNISEQYRYRPYSHPELNHGLDLLKSDEGLDCYIGAYGEMHQAKCRAAMQNMPFPPNDRTNISLSLEIIDWGCGQGIGTVCLVDYLKERELTQWLKKITLIEPSEASLSRAIANVTKAACNGIRITPLNEYLPSVSDDSETKNIHYEQNYVFHIFSNILDVTEIDLVKLAKSIAIPGHTHYILCMGPLNANAFRIDRFCDIFAPTEFFSNISSGNYGQTSDTNYRYTCKTKALVYNGGGLDFSKYDPKERATEPIYNEYNLNLQILNGLISKEKGRIYSILRSVLSANDLIYLDPELNGASPDFIIVRPNVGVVVISVFEEDLLKCHLDNRDQTNNTKIVDDDSEQSETKQIQSPLVDLDNYQNLIIESLKEFTEAVIEDNKNLGLVRKVLICTKGSLEQAKSLLGEPKYTTIYGNEFIDDKYILCRIFDDLKFKYKNQAFDNVALNQLIKDLSPKWHSYREGIPIRLTRQQETLSRSIEGAQRKISGVAGSGKTQVLATRAVNAQVRTGGNVLLLTFNITLANYMQMRLSQVRADFSWDKIDIDYYHRFFRKYANANNLHVHLGSYDNADFFKFATELKKYDAIFIDEVQDYLTPWLQLLRKYFLKVNGEFVVFGDPKQNIYHRELDKQGDIRLEFISGKWNHELDKSMRFSNPALANLAMAFQQRFYGSSEVINLSKDDSSEVGFQFNLMKYDSLDLAYSKDDLAKQVYKICKDFIDINSLKIEDVVILAPQTEILRQIDYLYRQETGKGTTVTFVKKEAVNRISRHSTLASYEYKRDYDRLEKVEKNRFSMVSHHLKLSTIQSFKGWEAQTVICIIPKDAYKDVVTSPELIYTGITRAKENLFVINIGNNDYDEFFKTNIH